MRFFESSIRIQLFLMAAIVALPAAAIILQYGLQARREAIDHAHMETRTLADGIAYRQESLVASARQLLNGLAQLPDVRERNIEKIQPVLTDILTMNPQYLNIFIVDRQGTMWVSAVPSNSPISVADRRHFINAMATGQFSSGECIVGRQLRKVTITFSHPIRNQKGELDGVIAVNFDLRYADRFLDSSRLPPGLNFLITDHKGVVLRRGIDPAPFLGKPTDPELLRQMEKADSGTFVSRGLLDGIQRFVTYRKLYLEGEETPYMYVRAGIPVETVLAKANRDLLRNLGLLSTVLLVGFAAAWVIGRRSIVARVSALQTASQRLAEGDFRVRIADTIKGGELGSLAASFDAMAAELQQQQDALKAKALVLESMAEGVSECDGKGRTLFTNQAFDAMFGYGRGELTGVELKILLEDRDGENRDLCSRIAHHLQVHPLWCGEMHNRKKDGTAFHTYTRISRIPGTDRFVTVQEDITERKKLARLQEEMISAVSHDMRTPLTAILGFHEYLQENEFDMATLQESLSIMYKETQRLDELIGNFLDLQRISAKRMEYDFAPVDVENLLRETAALFANASRNHRVIVNALPELPPVCGDETRLHQVLNNLVSNAIKYSPKRCDIILGARQEESFVTLWVRDGGIGIPAEALEKIFDRFYRAHAGSFHCPGSGLGLALVREIIENHGGSVRVESTPGEGSTFFVSLPIAPASLLQAG